LSKDYPRVGERFNLAEALYLRGQAKSRKPGGDDDGKRDIAEANAINPDIARETLPLRD
jgi:hypothetical protein